VDVRIANCISNRRGKFWHQRSELLDIARIHFSNAATRNDRRQYRLLRKKLFERHSAILWTEIDLQGS